MKAALFHEDFRELKFLKTPERDYPFYYLPPINSTNNYAKKFPGMPPAVFLTPEQTEGRGRFERIWISPPYSGLYFSILYSSLPFRENPGMIPIICAVSIAEAIEELYGLTVDIKWPNDLYLDGGKIAGILVESVVQQNVVQRYVIGIGINLFLPEGEAVRKDLSRLPTNPRFLEEFMTVPPRPRPLLEKVLHKLDKKLFHYEEKETIDKWMEHCSQIGKETTFRYRGESITGSILGLNSEGNLIVRQEKEEITLTSSDISFR